MLRGGAADREDVEIHADVPGSFGLPLFSPLFVINV